MIKTLQILVLIFLIPPYAASASSLSKVDRQDISQFEISVQSKNFKEIASKFEIISIKNSKAQVYVQTFRTKEFLNLGAKSLLVSKSIYSNNDKGLSKKGYRSFKEVVEVMKSLVRDYPKIVSLHTYGKSVKGNNLYYLKISDNVAIDEQEPELMITAATHGDEIITTESLLRFLVTMLKSKASSSRISKMIEDHELFFIPVVNPDGFKKRRRYTADGTDPNREYPYPERPNKSSVQCIKKEIEFFKTRNFAGSLDLHAYGKMIMYPWGFTKDEVPSAEKNMFESLGKKMGKINKYKVGQISRIIYVAPASSADYYYWQNNTISFGIELGTSKAPSFRRISKVVEQTTSMLYKFIENF